MLVWELSKLFLQAGRWRLVWSYLTTTGLNLFENYRFISNRLDWNYFDKDNFCELGRVKFEWNRILILLNSAHCNTIWKMGPILDLESNKAWIGNDANVPEGWNEVEMNHWNSTHCDMIWKMGQIMEEWKTWKWCKFSWGMEGSGKESLKLTAIWFGKCVQY